MRFHLFFFTPSPPTPSPLLLLTCWLFLCTGASSLFCSLFPSFAYWGFNSLSLQQRAEGKRLKKKKTRRIFSRSSCPCALWLFLFFVSSFFLSFFLFAPPFFPPFHHTPRVVQSHHLSTPLSLFACLFGYLFFFSFFFLLRVQNVWVVLLMSFSTRGFCFSQSAISASMHARACAKIWEVQSLCFFFF